MVFNTEYPNGIPDAEGNDTPAAVAAKLEHDMGINVLQSAHASGKLLMGESPVSRGSGSPFAFKDPVYKKHRSAWRYPNMAQFVEHAGLIAIYADQGAAGGPNPKTT